MKDKIILIAALVASVVGAIISFMEQQYISTVTTLICIVCIVSILIKKSK